MSKPLKKITKDLDALLEDVTDALKKGGANATEEAQEALAKAVVALADAAKDMIADAKKSASTLAKGAAEEVRAHPIATAATLAVAAAAVAGLFAARNRSGKA